MLSVVVGASRGIGLGLAEALAGRGERVIATARGPAPALAATGVEVAALELLNQASIDRFVDRLSDVAIDRLVLNAGLLGPREQDGSEALSTWHDVLMTNTAAPLMLAARLLPRVLVGGSKQIVFISSDNASLALCEGDKPIYRASKAGLNCGMRALALSYPVPGLSLFAIHPGWVQTDMGGPRAIITVAQSVAGMLSVFDRRPPTGSYWSYQGEELPW